jgi:hypothetical protein
MASVRSRGLVRVEPIWWSWKLWARPGLRFTEWRARLVLHGPLRGQSTFLAQTSTCGAELARGFIGGLERWSNPPQYWSEDD